MKVRFVVAAVAFLSLGVFAFSQTAPDVENGFKAYGSYDGSSIDSVNLMNGNLMLHIPMPFTYPQRGGIDPRNILTVSSKQWHVQCNGADCAWTTGSGDVPSIIANAGNGVGFDITTGSVVHREYEADGDSTGVTYLVDNYFLNTTDGATHQFAAVPGSAVDANGDTLSWETVDTSGYHLQLDNAIGGNGVTDTGFLIDRHGNRYRITGFPGPCRSTSTNNGLPGDPTTTTICTQISHVTDITDVNGNVYSLTSSTNTPLDTMGRPFTGFSSQTTLPSPVAGCVYNGWPSSTTYEYTYAGPNGASNQIYVCYATVTIQTAFGQSGVKEAQNATGVTPPLTASMITTVIMPDGSKWVFNYDSYGNVVYVGLPLGGSISYSWETVSIDPNSSLTHMSRAVKQRTLNDNNGHSFTWNYQWGTVANGTLVNTATDGNGDDTVHTFSTQGNTTSGLFETTTQSYQGSGGARQLLKQVDTTYQSITVSGIPENTVPTSIKTTVYPSGKTKLVTRQYDSGYGANSPIFGNVTKEFVYDWGQNSSPGPLLQETDTTYEYQVDGRYLTAHMPDLPASVVVKDGGGNRVAETDYTYDEPAYLTAYTGALPTGTHVAAPNPVRGNATTVSKWLNTTNTFIASHTKFYDTGEVYQSMDPLGHTTTHSYDPAYAGAYPTETCNALNQCVSATYDFQTGAITSFTDANAAYQANGTTVGDPAHSWTYCHDPMGRVTAAQFPGDTACTQPLTSFNYAAGGTVPFSVQRLKKITSSLSDSTTTFFDGLGRPYRTQHATPSGNATVDTTYDALDQAVSVTNPYFSSTDPTYGQIQTQYDALGRAIRLTEQDGSARQVAYDQVSGDGDASVDCTVSADEAGKQRATCVDGMGRLTKVLEPNPGANPTHAGGWVSVSGNEQSATSQPASTASVTVTISGSDTTNTSTFCGTNGFCRTTTNPDTGGLSFTLVVGGVAIGPVTTPYGSSSSPNSLAVGLYNNFPANSVVTMSNPGTGNSFTLTTVATGNSMNNSTIFTSVTDDCTNSDTLSCGGIGWSMALSGPNLATTTVSPQHFTGGQDASITPDSGLITATINGTPYQVSFGSGDNSGTIATRLAGVISAGTLANASASGGTVTLTSKTSGSAGDYTLSTSYTWNHTFVSPSFTTSSSASISGGLDTSALNNNPYVTAYHYDALGNLLCVHQKASDTTADKPCGDATVPASWRERRFTYDSFSRLLTAFNPESGQMTYAYDNDSNLVSKTDARGVTTNFSPSDAPIDPLHRVRKKTYSNGDPPVTYTYDTGVNGVGMLAALTDAAGSGSYTYDARGRISTEQRIIAGITKNMAYSYNLDSSVATVTYPSGAVVTYTPDSAGRLISAVDSVNHINYVTSAAYQADGQMTGFVSGNGASFAGITSAFTYNKRLQPVNMSANAPSQTVFSIGYDFHVGNGTTGSDNGNVWGITNYKDQTRNQTFAYDLLNRLTSAQNAGTNCAATTVNGKTEYWGNTYGYDAWGNLIQKTVTKCSAENMSLTALTNNQLTGYGYDAAGNMTSDPTDSVSSTYDAENRIATANTPQGVFTYTYDADGNRVEKSGGGTGTLYWYMSPGIIGESDLSGVMKSEYVFFNGERVARRDYPSGSVAYYFSDHLKTASVTTDSAGNIKSESDYYPWGGELQFVNNDSNHYKFTGKERDTESGLDYFGARYYSNGLGRFITPDWAAKATNVPYAQFGDPQTLNLYGYVRNIPTSLVDGDGHSMGALSNEGFEGFESFWGTLASGPSESNKQKQKPQQQQAQNTGSGGFWQKLGNLLNDKGWKSDAQVTAAEAKNRADWAKAYPGRPYPDIKIGVVTPVSGMGGLAKGAGEVESAIGNINKLEHIFGNAAHNLESLVSEFGSREAAGTVIQQATEAAVRQQGLTGVFETSVKVGSQSITVRGAVVDGAVKIGTVFK